MHNTGCPDDTGYDILSRIMQGALISLIVAVLVEVVRYDITLGVTIGVLAGYFGGWIHTLLARFTDLMFAFPRFSVCHFALWHTGTFSA